jgi:ferrochelatase
MRYGQPDISGAITRLQNAGVRKLLVLPLYPQYSASTTASTFDALAADFRKRRWIPELRFITHYHDNAGFISACALQITNFWQRHEKPQKLIFSYHGLPKRYLDAGDPYFCQCHKTSRLIAEHMGLNQDQWMTAFQSRFGREEWLKPYTDETLKALPNEGVTDVQVFCPGFSADCLETIEEIGIENRDYFLQAGGQKYAYIPALNAEMHHIAALQHLITSNLQGWEIQDISSRAQRAKEKGALS